MVKRVLAAGAAILVAAAVLGQAVLAKADNLTWHWDGPVNNLSWQGNLYYTAADTFLGDRVVVPGDNIRRTATFQNGGPSAAIATVQLVNLTATDYTDTVNTELKDLVDIYIESGGQRYDASWSQAISAGLGQLNSFGEKVSWQVSFPVAQLGVFDVMAGAHFPVAATTGQAGGHASEMLSFAVRIYLVGDTSPGPPSPTPTPPGPTATPTATPTAPPTSPGPVTPPAPGVNAGGSVLASPLIAGGVAAGLAGSFLLAGARASRGRHEPAVA